MDVRELYQEVILDHSRRPRNFGRPPGCNREANGHNPLCGDRISVYVEIADGVVKDVAFEGAGCAISMASASLMTEQMKGMSEHEAEQLFDRFRRLMTEETGETAEPGLDRLAVLGGVREFPVRVKCATLAWHTLKAALANTHDEVKTE
jgi:nitrogen fixation NifU-like protein